MKSLRTIAIACLIPSWGSLVQAQTGTNWHVEQVGEERADYVAIDVDAQGVPHVGFRAFGAASELRHAERPTSGWSVDPVDTKPGTGVDPSLRIDGAGQPRISYADTDNLDPAVKLASRIGSSWTLEDVAPDLGVRTSLALGPGDSPVIAYANFYDNMTLYLASLRDGQWVNRKLTNNTVGGLSLALDPAGRPRIAYVDAVAGTLKYARFNGFNWQFETIAPVAVEHYATSVSLVAGPDGRAFIAYDTGDTLRYAVRGDGIWRTHAVDEGAGVSVSFVSLRLDGIGNAHIAYAARKLTPGVMNAEVRYARGPAQAPISWTIRTVDSGYAILGVSMGLDAGGSAHIAYVWDDALRLLRYATNAP